TEHLSPLLSLLMDEFTSLHCTLLTLLPPRSLCDFTSHRTFVLINTTMFWTVAQNYCREHHTDLAMVRNIEENQMVQNLLPSRDIAWIGLHREGWKWSDGSDSSLRNWRPDQPLGSTKSCVAADFRDNGLWVTMECNDKSAFICYSGEHIA
uniref:C-type lectin domain-containing protein n=1 Tax=Cyclopterus lumpus TaxID=8103 RepID=A0A8C2WG48_CYCLU